MRPPRVPRIALYVSIPVALALLANLPVSSRVGIDYEVHERTLPLYEKLLAFLDRDVQMRSTAWAIVGDARGAEARALRVLAWTTENIRPVPAGFPVVDDHPYSIVVRGYGTDDQVATVFANLATYAGLEARRVFAPTGSGGHYAFVAVEIDRAWRVFDPREGLAFRRPDRRLASAEELRDDARLTEELPIPRGSSGTPYPVLLARLDVASGKTVTDQIPLERLRHELSKLLGISR